MSEQRYEFLVGIDPGRRTGVAIKDIAQDAIVDVDTCEMWEAWDRVARLHKEKKGAVAVVIEDARLGGGPGRRSQGAGSVKRDCSAWEEFLRGKGIPAVWLSPRQAAKGKRMTEEAFRKWVGYDGPGRISEHARDAAMMIYGYTEKIITAQLYAQEKRKKWTKRN